MTQNFKFKQMGKGEILLRATLSLILFSFFLKMDSIFSFVDSLVERGWSLSSIIVASVLIRMISAGFVVLILIPLSLRCVNWRVWLPGFLRIDRRTVAMGIVSFLLFCALAVAISSSFGIFIGDLSTVFSNPDLRQEPDVIGWGYFLLAFVPAIWEELAFRGLIQSKLRKAFSTTSAILLSSLFFSLFHLSNLVSQAPSQVIFGAIMAFFFGIGWGFMTIQARSVVPAMISHYLVDSLGQILIAVDPIDPVLASKFFVLLTLLFPLVNIVFTKLFYPGSGKDVNETSRYSALDLNSPSGEF